jgi:hypothetical protein
MADLSVADVVENHRAGTITVILQIPYRSGGREIKAITIGPFTRGINRRWKAAEFKTSDDLLAAVCTDHTGKPLTAAELDDLRDADNDRINAKFAELMPHEMRDALVMDEWPGKPRPAPPPVPEAPNEDYQPLNRRRMPLPPEGDEEPEDGAPAQYRMPPPSKEEWEPDELDVSN